MYDLSVFVLLPYAVRVFVSFCFSSPKLSLYKEPRLFLLAKTRVPLPCLKTFLSSYLSHTQPRCSLHCLGLHLRLLANRYGKSPILLVPVFSRDRKSRELYSFVSFASYCNHKQGYVVHVRCPRAKFGPSFRCSFCKVGEALARGPR